MDKTTRAAGSLFSTLHERAKELRCLYRVEELLNCPTTSPEEAFAGVAQAIPPALQHSDICVTEISYGPHVFRTDDYEPTPWGFCADIRVQDAPVGKICVYYREERPQGDEGQFLREEVKLLRTIADRLGHYILHHRLRAMFETVRQEREQLIDTARPEWFMALELLRKTDPDLLTRISRKMINYLAWIGAAEARSLLQRYGVHEGESLFGETNQPQVLPDSDTVGSISEETFRVSTRYLTDHEILSSIEQWIQEDRSAGLVRTLQNVYAPLTDILDAMQKFRRMMPVGATLPTAAEKGVKVALIRRFFTEQLEYINIAKRFIEIEDFFELSERIIFPAGSYGRLGGKTAGLFLASRILKRMAPKNQGIGTVKTPRTWFVASDGILAFIGHNNLGDVYEQKYKEVDEVRREYPQLIQVFKHCYFPQELVKGLSQALDDLGEVPVIVRSSSLLEDRLGTAFSGKYKSLFIANQGPKEERLAALLDAVAEVYSSTFGPDPIEYRAERGLLDFNEEMGVMIQEVVGKRVGKYFLPAFAGVAFSRNEFRWSSRIKREDGLLRLVPGLGTRAVDRVGDDYPVLVAPSKPNLRVNVSVDEVIRYAPKKVDVINLEKNCFESLEIKQLLEECGHEYPALSSVFSVHSGGMLTRGVGLMTDFQRDDVVATFDTLVLGTPFVKQMAAILRTLDQALQAPVDVEFAHDGTDLYLLQCRPQASSGEDVAAEIPRGLPDEAILFTANRFVSNGRVPDLTHVVYVDPDKYGELAELADLCAVGEAVGRLNKILPRRKFVLIGPGRWGSRGDIKLGVRVTYSEINNTAMLIEVARKKGNYVPDVSFGTHFFQDLVEASIRYLPLYPDTDGTKFNEAFLLGSPNILAELLPEFAHLADTLRVIDVPRCTEGKVLRVLMNADQEEAIGCLAEPSVEMREVKSSERADVSCQQDGAENWRWRLRMAERIAAHTDPQRFGIRAMYILGSTKNATAGPASDIDLLIHFSGTPAQRQDLTLWLEGWSLCLGEINQGRTGCRSDGLLDVHIITDEDIAGGDSFAVKIGASTDAARELPMKGAK
ncbi:pyruvate, phosphate dikinase [Candidatus Fermentibacteria bacterium]|nr:pyruvate, phosphate dikinase [Candidatus Fermentibacteria bacterium]